MGLKPDFVEVVLTCSSWQEAHQIADELLQKYLIGYVEFVEVEAEQWRKNGLAGAKEIKLIMETVAHKFAGIEQAITDFHGATDFTLQQAPLTQLSPKAQAWLERTT